MSVRFTADAVIDLNDIYPAPLESDVDVLSVASLCACNDCAALSVNVITPPLVISNIELSNIASSKTAIENVMYTN